MLSEGGENCCRKDMEAHFSDLILKKGAEADTSRSRLDSGWEKDSNNGRQS